MTTRKTRTVIVWEGPIGPVEFDGLRSLRAHLKSTVVGRIWWTRPSWRDVMVWADDSFLGLARHRRLRVKVLRIVCPDCGRQTGEVEGTQSGISHVLCPDCLPGRRAEVDRHLQDQDLADSILSSLGKVFGIDPDLSNS